MPDPTPATVWDRIAARYQARMDLPTDRVLYGPLAPDEDELGLLGPVAGLRVLDAGCGGGQNCLALARLGADVTGVDASRAQLDHARTLAAAVGPAPRLLHGDVTDLTGLPAGYFHRVLSVFTLHYVADAAGALAGCARLLAPGGRLILSTDHPIRAAFFDAEEDELALFPVRSYFDAAPLRWPFADTGVQVESYHRTVGQWCDLVAGAGLRLRRVLEPPAPPHLLDQLWPEDGALAPLRNLPQTLIIVAETPGGPVK